MPAMRRISWYSSSVTGEMIKANVLEEFQLSHCGILPEFVQRYLPREAFHCAQVGDEHFRFQVMRVGIRVPCDFGDRVDGAFGCGVVTKDTVALTHLSSGRDLRPGAFPRPATSPCLSQTGYPSDTGADSPETSSGSASPVV